MKSSTIMKRKAIVIAIIATLILVFTVSAPVEAAGKTIWNIGCSYSTTTPVKVKAGKTKVITISVNHTVTKKKKNGKVVKNLEYIKMDAPEIAKYISTSSSKNKIATIAYDKNKTKINHALIVLSRNCGDGGYDYSQNVFYTIKGKKKGTSYVTVTFKKGNNYGTKKIKVIVN